MFLAHWNHKLFCFPMRGWLVGSGLSFFVVALLCLAPPLDSAFPSNRSRSSDPVKHPEVLYSITVPTYREAENIPALLDRLASALDANRMLNTTELVIVDDSSNDGTVEAVEEFNKQSPAFRVRLVVRDNERGLSSAVIRGFKESKGQYLLCMDADLQHPPETAPILLQALHKRDCGFVVGTRYPSQQTLKEYGIEDDTSLIDSSWGRIRTANRHIPAGSTTQI